MNNLKEIKCVIWDLDGTLWHGILLEGDCVQLKPDVHNIIQTLDKRGILHSIASKNDFQSAMEKLSEFGLHEYFLYPEINWNPKSLSISRIQANLNLQMDSLLFIDDEALELEEVKSEHPEVMCVNASDYSTLLNHPRLNPMIITEDSSRRRQMYLQQKERIQAEEEFIGPRKEFLASLNMVFSISRATENDLKRAEELTIRTNQLNTTGRPYDYDELKKFINSPNHELLVCELQDKYGDHGKIGLALIELGHDYNRLMLFLLSCRVMSLGVGTVLLSYIMRMTEQKGKKLKADFKHTGRNRPMFITFKMSNFKDLSIARESDIILENDLSLIPPYPPYLELSLPD